MTPAVTSKMTRAEAKTVLLKSLLGGRKFLHFGRTPVDAVELALEMAGDGLVKIDDNWVTITVDGRAFLENPP